MSSCSLEVQNLQRTNRCCLYSRPKNHIWYKTTNHQVPINSSMYRTICQSVKIVFYARFTKLIPEGVQHDTGLYHAILGHVKLLSFIFKFLMADRFADFSKRKSTFDLLTSILNLKIKKKGFEQDACAVILYFIPFLLCSMEDSFVASPLSLSPSFPSPQTHHVIRLLNLMGCLELC